MSRVLKIWLWIVLVLHIVTLIQLVPILKWTATPYMTVISEVLLMIGILILIFAENKKGFYLICAVQAVFLLRMIFKFDLDFRVIISAVVMPAITFILMRPDWKEID